jgi:hypothetical protein
MLINDINKSSFYHIMKTGGHSIHSRLQRNGPYIISLGMHGSYRELHEHLPAIYDKIKDYYKFCFIRNPFSHALSMYFHILHKDRWGRSCNLNSKTGLNTTLDEFRDFNHFLEYVYQCQSTVTVDDPYFMNDDWFKYENINHAWEQICGKFGYTYEPLEQLNTTPPASNSNMLNLSYPVSHVEFYDQRGVDIISEKCKTIIAKFNYNF